VANNISWIRKKKWIPVSQRYNASILYTFIKYKFKKVKVQIDDNQSFENQCTILAICNGQYYGGGFRMAPHATLDDGLFEVILIKGPKNPVEFQTMFNGFIFQNDNSMVMHFKCSDISFTSEEQIPWVLDGEFGGNQTKVNIRVENKKVRYLLAKHP
jgi:diacylglycerol kinase family enzyme